MIGTWLGYYMYDNPNCQKATGFDRTFFTITITSFDEKNFKGTVVDDIKSGGMEGIGEIIGEIKGNTILFKLTYNAFSKNGCAVSKKMVW